MFFKDITGVLKLKLFLRTKQIIDNIVFDYVFSDFTKMPAHHIPPQNLPKEKVNAAKPVNG